MMFSMTALITLLTVVFFVYKRKTDNDKEDEYQKVGNTMHSSLIAQE